VIFTLDAVRAVFYVYNNYVFIWMLYKRRLVPWIGWQLVTYDGLWSTGYRCASSQPSDRMLVLNNSYV
jgi:hypothetical protein